MSEEQGTVGYIESASELIYDEISSIQTKIEHTLDNICNALPYEKAMALGTLYRQMADRIEILKTLDSIEVTSSKEEAVYRKLIESQNSPESSILDMMCNLEDLHEHSCEFIEKKLTKLFK